MKKLSQEEFINKAKEIHNNKYDYSKVNYINNKIKIKIICPVHGKFEQIPADHKRGIGCIKCGFITTKNKISSSTFINDANKIHNNRYDYSKVKYVNNKTKVKITCPIHGEFEQIPNNHLKYGCFKCGVNISKKNRTKSLKNFILQSKKIFKEKYNYSLSQYVNSNTKIKIICNKHNYTFGQYPHNHLRGCEGCPKCTNRISKFETEIFDFISIPNKEKNNRSILNGLELDIYLPDKKIAIECNGNYWHSELNGKEKSYHLNKTKECDAKGIQLLHIFESEWIQKADIWKSIIYSKLGLNKIIYARKCKIKEIETFIKNEFLNENHLQGEDKSSVKLGLYYDNTLVSLMTFAKSRFNKKYEWEISRFASKANYSIIGGASKLLTYFKRNYNPTSIITYADRRYSTGNLYKTLGFKFSHYSNPNYFYTKNYLEYKSRIQFQKHKLKDKLQVFNESLTEWENMKNNEYDRIWDCGNSVWVWNK